MMRRRLAAPCVALALLAVATCSSEASAQSVPALPPPAAAPAPAAPLAAAPAPGMVRLHFHTYRARDSADVEVRTAQGGYALLCTSPCTVDLPPAAELRVSLDNSDGSNAFSVPNDLGAEIDVEVRAPAKGAIVGGIFMLAGAGLSLLVGAVLTSYAMDQQSAAKRGPTIAAGVVFLGLGAGLGLGGILLFTNRSHEPRVTGNPYRADRVADPERDRGNRRDRSSREGAMLGDVAAMHHEGPCALPPAFAPLQLGFAF